MEYGLSLPYLVINGTTLYSLVVSSCAVIGKQIISYTFFDIVAYIFHILLHIKNTHIIILLQKQAN